MQPPPGPTPAQQPLHAPPPSQQPQYQPRVGHHHHHHHHAPPAHHMGQPPQPQMQMPPTVSAATGTVVSQGVSSAGQPVQSQVQPSAVQPGQPQQPIRVYFQPQDPAAAALQQQQQQQPPNPNQVFVHHNPAANFMYRQPQYAVFNPAGAIYPGPGVAAPFSAQPQHVASYSQPPPTMPNQVSQQRPQTPPNPAAIGIPGAHTIINTHGPAAYSINPAVAQATAVANHHAMQQPPQQAAQLAQAQTQGPPPHQVQQSQQQAGQPVSQGQAQIPQQPQSMTHTMPYVRRPRSNALKIVNPDTMEEINAASAAAAAVKPSASTATSEGSPAPSEVASLPETNEAKDEVVSKEADSSSTAVQAEEAKPVEAAVKDDASISNVTSSSEAAPMVASNAVAHPEPVAVVMEVVPEVAAASAKAEPASASETSSVIHPATSSSDAGKIDESQMADADGKSKAKNKKEEEATITTIKKASEEPEHKPKQQTPPLKVENDTEKNDSEAHKKDITTAAQPVVPGPAASAASSAAGSKAASAEPEPAAAAPAAEVVDAAPPSREPSEPIAAATVEDNANHLEPISDEELNDSTAAKEASEELEEGEIVSDAEAAVENGTDSACSSTATSKSASLIKLKYEYPEEQWSPINTEGKKQYGRDFLLKLANDPLSKQKPCNMPPMDIIKDRPNPDKAKFSLPPGLPSKDWTPGFVKSTTSKGGMGGGGTKQGSRGPKPQPGRGAPGQHVIQLQISSANVELNKAENAWKPAAAQKEGSADAEDPLLELEKNVRSILNKLTPSNFDKLVKKFNELKIDSEKKLANSIELIFEKAVDEPEFSVAYAKMCDVLREKKVPKQDGSGGPVDFRKLLVTRCQKEFERDYMEGFDKTKYEKETAAATNEEDRKQLKLKFEAQERKARRRSLGNIRFIGELYNLKMLTDRIMHEIINKLIHQVDEESLECLCWLFNTIGKTLEQATNAKLSAPANDVDAKKTNAGLKPFDNYFKLLENIIRAGQQTLPSRVRFLLQDVVDLRRNQWKPRREKAGPKTLEQIHKEAEREKTAKKLMEMQPLPNHNQGGGGGHNRGQGGGRDDNRNKRGASRGGSQGQQGGDDDWNTVSRRGNNPNFNEKIDAQKVISLATSGKKDADSLTLGLGPANRGWGKGSGSAAKSPHPTQQGNRYAAIQDRQAEADSRDAGGPRRGYSASMGNFNRQGSASRGSSVDERQSALSAVKQFSTNGPSPAGAGPMVGKGMPSSHSSNVISANSTGNNAGGMVSGGPSMSMSSMAHMQAPSTVIEAQAMASQTKMLKGAKDLADERIRQKATSIVDECLHLGNTQSALDDICADFHPDHMKDVAEYVLLHVIEKKLKDIQKTGELLDYLVTKHALLPSQLENAFYIILDMSADLEIDIPKLWENVSMLLAPVLASEKSLPMKFLLESVKHLEGEQVPKFLKSVLKSLVEIKGHKKVDEMWIRSGLTISQLLPSKQLDRVPEIIKDTGLTSLTPTPNDQPQDVRSNLDRLLSDPRFDKNSEQKNDVISWIEDNVPAADRDGTAKNFLRTLARAVTGSSLNYDTNRREYSLEESKLEARCPLVKKYVDANTDREKQVLYALQHMMHEMEHPNKLLTNIFNCLYNNDVIAQEGFEAWLDCSEVSEQEGKGVAIKSTTHFFTWMRENEVDDEEP